MTKREAMALAKQINKVATVEVTGFRVERTRGGAHYDIDCRDRISGYPFVVRSREDWDERRAAVMLSALNAD